MPICTSLLPVVVFWVLNTTVPATGGPPLGFVMVVVSVIVVVVVVAMVVVVLVVVVVVAVVVGLDDGS